jgi:hypothetical protein
VPIDPSPAASTATLSHADTSQRDRRINARLCAFSATHTWVRRALLWLLWLLLWWLWLWLLSLLLLFLLRTVVYGWMA